MSHLTIVPTSSTIREANSNEYTIDVTPCFYPLTQTAIFIKLDSTKIDPICRVDYNYLIDKYLNKGFTYTLALIKSEIGYRPYWHYFDGNALNRSLNGSNWKNPVNNQRITEIFYFTLHNKSMPFSYLAIQRTDDSAEKKRFLALHFQANSLEEDPSLQIQAQNDLGVCYGKGLGVSVDFIQAFHWYEKAAKQGNSVAQSNLGYCYTKGTGVEVNHEQAFHWFKEAAKQGSARAQANLTIYQTIYNSTSANRKPEPVKRSRVIDSNENAESQQKKSTKTTSSI